MYLSMFWKVTASSYWKRPTGTLNYSLYIVQFPYYFGTCERADVHVNDRCVILQITSYFTMLFVSWFFTTLYVFFMSCIDFLSCFDGFDRQFITEWTSDAVYTILPCHTILVVLPLQPTGQCITYLPNLLLSYAVS